MNLRAYEENLSNKRHVKMRISGGVKVIEVNTHKITFRGRPWHALASFQKRKLENFLFLNDNEKIPKKVIYI